jgi:arginine decarboxylase
VLVPGQAVSKQILYFLAQLDVKEIHGYNADLGLSVFTEDALKRINAARHAIADAHGNGHAAQVIRASTPAING